MAPEQPAWLRVYDFHGTSDPPATLYYFEPSPGRSALRIRWEATHTPEDFVPVAGGVVHASDDGTAILPQMGVTPEHVGGGLNVSRFRWREGSHGLTNSMLVLVLPRGHVLRNASIPPLRAKLWQGRLAAYWIVGQGHLRDGGYEIVWDQIPGDPREVIQDINRRSAARDGGHDAGARPITTDDNRLALFIHGLGGSAQGTWRKNANTAGLGDLLSEHLGLDVAYIDYSRETRPVRLPLVSGMTPGIATLADGLRSQIDSRYVHYSDITLVCHSLGGLVARKYLVEETKRGNMHRVRRLVLYATPNNGADLARPANWLSRQHHQLRQMTRRSDLLAELNSDWHTFDMSHHVKTTFIYPTQDRIVDEESAKGFWGNDAVKTIFGEGHRSVVKPDSPNSDSFLFLVDAMTGGDTTLP